MNPDEERIADDITARHRQLHLMLTSDGFVLDSRGNRSVRLGIYLDYSYTAPDGRSAQIKFRPHLGREVRLTIRSTF